MSASIVSSTLTAKTFEELPSLVQAAVMKYFTKEDFNDEFVNNRHMNGSAKTQMLLGALEDIQKYQVATDKGFAWMLVMVSRYGRGKDEMMGGLVKMRQQIDDEEEQKKEAEEERDAQKKKVWIEEYKKTLAQQPPKKVMPQNLVTKNLLREVLGEYMHKKRPDPETDKYKCNVCNVCLSSHGALYNHNKSKSHLKMVQYVTIPTTV